MFAIFTTAAALTPQHIHLKTDKELVAAANRPVPGGPLYMVSGRSYSAEFYSRGHARAIRLSDFPQFAGRSTPTAFSVTPVMADEAKRSGLENMGAYGRYILLIMQSSGEVK